MQKQIFCLALVLSCCATSIFGQQIQILATADSKASLRGLSAVNEKIIWTSGSKGTVGRSADGGKTWEWMTVKNYETRDFRDIEAFDKNTAIIMAIADPAVILKTEDGGKKWKIVFTDSTKGMFMDAMDFQNDKMGIVVGDPVRDTIFIATTNDGGDHWQKLSSAFIKAEEGEGFFAASGTNVIYNLDGSFVAVSGGKTSRWITPYETKDNGIIQGKESTGANSIAISGDHAIIVGGDFSNDKDTTKNCSVSDDDMETWHQAETPPHGYRSCVTFISKDKMICCGTSGADISNDSGMNWQLISQESFHVCRKAKKGDVVFLAGANGRVAKLIW
jgi:photosystem II stability/assembly factor-like uncharacterized protein